MVIKQQQEDMNVGSVRYPRRTVVQNVTLVGSGQK